MAGAERFPQEIHITARLDHLEYRGPAVRRPDRRIWTPLSAAADPHHRSV